MAEETHLSVKDVKLSEIDTQLGAGADLELLRLIALDDIAVNSRRIRQAVELPVIQGYTASQVIPVTGAQTKIFLLLVEPFEAWATVAFVNQGPNTVFINLNNNQSQFKQLDYPGVWEVDFSKAKRRLDTIECHCNVGETSTLLADGKY